MSKVAALAQLFRSMGFSWSNADELCNAVEALGLNGARSDDVAAALLRWKAEACTAALGHVRRRARATLVGDGTLTTADKLLADALHETDVEGQSLLFDTIDERARRGTRTPMQDGK